SSTERRKRDQRIVDAKLPHNTRFLSADGIDGWLYSITTEFADEYKFYVYFDGQHYMVRLVWPELEKEFTSSHKAHLFLGEGRACLSQKYNGGMPTIDEAFAKSVLWAYGIST